METIRVKINPYKDINIISLDGKALSPYSELNNFMKEPFLKWAYKLFEVTERELNDDFGLVVVADEFEKKFLKDMQEAVESCVSFAEGEYELSDTIENRLLTVEEIARKYGVLADVDAFSLPLYSEHSVVMDDRIQVVVPENAFVHITKDSGSIKQYIGGRIAKIFLVISDKNKVTYIADTQYVWEITEDRIDEILGMLSDRFVTIPRIRDAVEKLSEMKDLLTKEDRNQLNVVTEVDTLIKAEVLPSMEVETAYIPVLSTIPGGQGVPEVRMVSQNPAIITVVGDTLQAKTIGRTVIEFYKSDEVIPFAKHEIIVFKDNSIRTIRLSAENKVMRVGSMQNISISVLPEGAEATDTVRWYVDNDEIATVDDGGYVCAKRPGKVEVVASSINARESVEIEVLPCISNMIISARTLQIPVGSTEEVTVSCEPRRVFNDTVEWITTNASVAIVEKVGNGKATIRAKGFGTCKLVCKAVDGGCQDECIVEAKSRLYENDKKHLWLAVSFIGTLLAIFCRILFAPAGIYLGGIAAIISAIIAMCQNKNDVFWSIVLMIVSIIMMAI